MAKNKYPILHESADLEVGESLGKNLLIGEIV